MAFYQGFSLDTLLGVISVLLGVVALILGGKAYHNCKDIRKSYNDKKKFGDNCEDNSQKAGGDIINNSCDTEALAKVSAANFEVVLKHAYDVFDQQAKSNLQQIIEETNRIIQEQKPNIAGLTKVDWINIYFESAKNTSDEYMQKVWARVLAKEMECPGSFSYKTLDVLKNMSADDFKLFEKMCSFGIDNVLLSDDIYTCRGLTYVDRLKLKELGLLSFEESSSTYLIQARGSSPLVYGDFCILIGNPNDEKITVKSNVFVFSSVAKEIKVVAKYCTIKECAVDIMNVLHKANPKAHLTLHEFIADEKGIKRYQEEDIYAI